MKINCGRVDSMQKKKVIIEDDEKIIEYLEGKSDSIIELIENNRDCE